MIDMDMMASLLDALDQRTRLILLGDKDQLASVEAGAVMGDLCRDADKGLYTRTRWPTCAGLRRRRQPGPATAPPSQQTAILRTNWRFRHARHR